MFKHAEEARSRGIKVIIAGAGGAAHLPGMVAAKTTLPVIGVPVKSRALSGVDSLYSIVQMPGGCLWQQWLLVKQVRQTLPSLPSVSFSRGRSYRDSFGGFCRRTRKNRRGVYK